jgi:lysozyme
MMKLSKNGIKLIKSFEGLVLHAYQDVAGVWTIGYGSTRFPDGKAVKSGDKLTSEAQADSLLQNTLSQYEDAVNSYVLVPLTQNQYDALISFTYNLGTHALLQSTLLNKLNMKDYAAAVKWFTPWNKITDPHTGRKVVCDTLTKRRIQESILFKKL